MSYAKVGSCPKCGAPIYSPSIWHGVTPPPVSYSCSCAGISGMGAHPGDPVRAYPSDHLAAPDELRRPEPPPRRERSGDRMESTDEMSGMPRR